MFLQKHSKTTSMETNEGQWKKIKIKKFSCRM
jgi:hypothetical protein